MSFCIKCGNKVEEGAKFCEHCGAPVSEMTPPQPSFTAQQSAQTPPPQAAAYTQNAQQTNAAPYQQPYAQQPSFTAQQSAQTPPPQAAAYTQNAQQTNAAPYQQPYAKQPPYQASQGVPAMQTPDYEKCVDCAKITDIVSGVLLVVAVFVALFVHAYAGMFLCLAAEIVALIPTTKLQNAFKQQNTNPDKKAAKEEEKQLRKELKSKSTPYRLSFILAIVSLVCLLVFLFLSNILGI